MGLMKSVIKRAYGGQWGFSKGECVTVMKERGDGDIEVITTQDPSNILRANQILRNAADYTGDFQGDDWGRRVARVPNTTLMEWLNKLGVNYLNPAHQERCLQLLDDPEYEDCKVVNEKVARKKRRIYCRASTSPNPIKVVKEFKGA